MKSLPTPDVIEPATQHGHQDGQTTHDMDAFPGPLAVQMAEPSNTVYQSWKGIADNPSDLSGYRNDHTTSVVELPVQCSDQDEHTTHDMAAFPGSLAVQMTEPSNTVRKSWRDMADRTSDLSGYGNDLTTSVVELPVQCSDQDGQITHDMAALPGPLAVPMTETSDTVYQSWRVIAKNPSDVSGYGHEAASEPLIQSSQQGGQTTHDMDAFPRPLPFQMTEPSNTVLRSWRYIAGNPSAFNMSTARINQRVNTGHESSIPQQELGVTEDFPRTSSVNSLISEDDHDDDSFGCLRAAFKGIRPIQQKLIQLVTRMMGTNEEQISNVDVGRNPNKGFVCNSRVQISCCHIVCLPFNDDRCQVGREPVEDTMERL